MISGWYIQAEFFKIYNYMYSCSYSNKNVYAYFLIMRIKCLLFLKLQDHNGWLWPLCTFWKFFKCNNLVHRKYSLKTKKVK